MSKSHWRASGGPLYSEAPELSTWDARKHFLSLEILSMNRNQKYYFIAWLIIGPHTDRDVIIRPKIIIGQILGSLGATCSNFYSHV